MHEHDARRKINCIRVNICGKRFQLVSMGYLVLVNDKVCKRALRSAYCFDWMSTNAINLGMYMYNVKGIRHYPSLHSLESELCNCERSRVS